MTLYISFTRIRRTKFFYLKQSVLFFVVVLFYFLRRGVFFLYLIGVKKCQYYDGRVRNNLNHTRNYYYEYYCAIIGVQ